MFEKLRKTKWNLGAKLSLATLLTVAVIMVVLMFVINMRVTSTIQQRAEMDMQQSMDMVYGFLASSDQDLRERTQKITKVFQSEHARSAQTLDVGDRKVLLLNGASANGDNALLDRFQTLTTAASTVFVLDNGKFKSIASTVELEDGNRAVGATIPEELEAHQLLLQGKEYLGLIKLFGKEFMAHYSPLHDANKQVIGAVFIGMDFSAFLESIKKTLRELKVGKDGYYFVMQTSGPQRGTILVHPRVEGDNLWERQDAQGHKYIQHMLGHDRGTHIYDVLNKDQSIRTMMTTFRRFAPWDWTIATSVNESEILEAGKQLQLIFIVLGLLSILTLTGAIYWVLRRTVVMPLYKGLEVTEALAKGDLTQRAPVHSEDEIGKLLQAINRTADSLDGLIRTVQQKANGVTLASEEIARGNADLANRTESSASALEETAAAMEELGSTVRHNADNATTADTLARQAQQVVNSSGQTVTALVETMSGINQSSQRIADIIGVIDGIAFQTNILALNAAVEAARAGEHGRGFAVVASEVRALAGRSAEAAKEIKTLIQNSLDEVHSGNARATEAGNSMQQAIEEINKVSRVISEISHASTEQSNGVGQVAEAITSMDQATQKNAALVEEVSAAAQSLSVQANELLQAVAIFKLRNQGMHSSQLRAGNAAPQEPRLLP